MFLRCYLLCRFAIYHSSLTQNVGHQSLGYLNQVSIDFDFLVKTSLAQWPARSLSIFLIIIWLIGSWALRACDRVSADVHLPMADTMWFFIVTYTTVGYGDLTPSSYCGRGKSNSLLEKNNINLIVMNSYCYYYCFYWSFFKCTPYCCSFTKINIKSMGKICT